MACLIRRLTVGKGDADDTKRFCNGWDIQNYFSVYAGSNENNYRLRS